MSGVAPDEMRAEPLPGDDARSFDMQASEQELIGAMLSADPHARIVATRRKITPDHFYHWKHRRIFEAIRAVEANGHTPSPAGVHGTLSASDRESITADDLHKLYIDTTTVRVEQSCENVRSAFQRRTLAVVAQEIRLAVAEIIDGDLATSRVLELVNAAIVPNRLMRWQTYAEGAAEVLEADREAIESRSLIGARTGIADIDDAMTGLEPGRLYTVGAHSSIGKTAFALQCSWINARDCDPDRFSPVLFISSEMTNLELIRRVLIAGRRGVNPRHVDNQHGQMMALDQMRQAFDDTAPVLRWEFLEAVGEHLASVEAEIAAKVAEHDGKPPRLICLDYLQHFAGDSTDGNTAAKVRDVSRRLKIIAKNFDCPVLATSQLRRPPQSGNTPPTLQDLFESSAIGNNSDGVILLHRTEPVTEPQEAELVRTGATASLNYQILLVKNRTGKLVKPATKFHPVWGLWQEAMSELTWEARPFKEQLVIDDAPTVARDGDEEPF